MRSSSCLYILLLLFVLDTLPFFAACVTPKESRQCVIFLTTCSSVLLVYSQGGRPISHTDEMNVVVHRWRVHLKLKSDILEITVSCCVTLHSLVDSY